MGTLWQDIRYGFRMLVRNPAEAAVTILTLALGIGATTAIFSMVNGVLLCPLAYPHSDRLVCLHEMVPAVAQQYPLLPVNARHAAEWQQRCSSLESLSLICLFETGPMSLTGRGEPESLEALRVSANLFETLGVQPALGRAFVTQEETPAQHHVVVISDALWRQTFHADPSIIGTAVTLDNEVYTVIGVLPARFRFPTISAFGVPWTAAGTQPKVFTPKVFSAQEQSEMMGMFNFGAIARLKKNVTAAQALAELNGIAPQIEEMAGQKVDLRAAVKPLKQAIVARSQRGLLVLLGAIGSVLLIACLNLAILNLVRAERGRFDSSVRMALGAGRAQLLRQALTEPALLAILGTVAGVAVAAGGLNALVALAPGDIPRLDEVRIDGRVLLFALGLTVTTGLLFGLLPGWRTAQGRIECVLTAGGRTATSAAGGVRLRNVFVATQVCLGVILLITAGLLSGSFSRVLQADKGFRAPRVLVAEIVPSESRYNTGERQRDFHTRLIECLSSLPGVPSAALTSVLPLQGESWVSTVYPPGDSRPDWERPAANVRFISAAYFQTLGIPLLAGRSFDEADRSRRVAVISAQLARKLWPQEDVVVGRRFLDGGDSEYEVIGVAGDVRVEADKPPVPIVYRPYWDGAPLRTVLVARTVGDPASMAGVVREAVRRADPDVPIARMRTMSEVLEESTSPRRFQMCLAVTFALSAVLLAGLGIYGVVSYSVVRRTREMGIRTAFGARPRHLHGMVLRQGMTPVTLGLLAGIAGALVVGRFLRSLLYDVSPRDPWTIAVAAVATLAVALAACYLPARRAARIDPMAALRYE